MRRHVLVIAALATACASKVDPTNPFDPDAPPELQAKAVVQGTIAAESLISQANIGVYLRANNQIVKQTETAADGGFLFDGVPPGIYAVEAAPPGFSPVTIPINVAAGQDLQLGEITLTPLLGADAGTLSGTATLEGQTFNGGILVEVAGYAYTALTDSSGAYQLEVPEGTYELRFTYASYSSASVTGVAVAKGETSTVDPVVLLGNPATVSGHADGELAGGGYEPLAGAIVTLDGTSATGLTQSDGSFALTGVPAGSYVLRIVKDGYETASYPVLNLSGGELRGLDAIELALARGRLEGVIALADTADASGCVVEVTGTGRAAVTASSGSFAFEGLVAGTYDVSVRRDGYGGQARSGLAVPGGGTKTVSTITLARQGGAVSIVQAPYTSSRAVTLSLSAASAVNYKASEDPAFADAALGDVDWTPYGGSGSTRAFTLSDADGEHVVYVVFSDGTSPSTPASASVVLDRQAPSLGAVTIGSGGDYASEASVTLTLSAQDLPAVQGRAISGLSKMHVSNRADFVGASILDYNVTTPWTLTAGDAAKTVWVRFVDRAGNVSAPASATVTLDGTPPTGTLALSGSGGFAEKTGSPVVTATLTASDLNGGTGNADVSVRLSNSLDFSGAVWQPFASSLSWVLSPGDGAKTVYAQLRDPAGNVSDPPASATIDLLTTPPSSGTLVLASGAAATSSSIVPCAISAVGAVEMRLFVNGAAATGWIPYATTTSVDVGTTPDQATRIVSIGFRNGAGVEGGGTSAAIRYDATPPLAGAISLVGSLGNGSTSTARSSSAIVVANVTPPVAGDSVEMAIAQAATGASPCSGAFASPAWQPLARTATIPLTGSDGDKRVCALFRDAAGNFLAANAAAANIVLDTTPPTNPAFVNVSTGTTSAWLAPAAGNPVVTAASDPGSTVTYQCVGGSTYPKWTDCGTSTTLPAPFQLLANGETTVGVRARDDAYNYSPGSFARIVQDSVAPFPPFITSIRSSRDSVTVAWDATGDTDVVQYLVHYGNVAGQLTGTGAAQGSSPVSAGAFTGMLSASFTLTGLTPGLPYYVAVEAVDSAGNRSGPSGERVAVPARANPRVVSTFAGRPRAVATVVETFDDGIAANDKTFAYLGENQAIVQLDVSSDSALPAVTARAYVPDLVPDARSGIVAFRCAKGSVQGHCVVAAGQTLEGDYRDDLDHYRAAAPVVFFPRTGTGTAPAVATVEGILPVRPSFVFQAAGIDPGETLLYTVDRAGLRAFSMKAGQLSLLREIARHDFANPLKTILGATLAGSELHVYARTYDIYETAPILFSFDMTDAWDGAIYGEGQTVLYDSATGTQHVLGELRDASAPQDVVPAMSGGIFIAFHGAGGLYLASYLPGNPNPQSKVFLGADDMDPIEAVGSAGIVNGHLYVLLQGGAGGLAASLVPVSGSITLGAPVGVSQGDAPIGGGGWAALNQSSQERLYAIGESTAGRYSLQRWTVSGTSATPAPAATFDELSPTWFAEADRFLYVSHGDQIATIDVSNPLTPIVTGMSAARAGRSFRKLVVHGRFLYAMAGSYGVEVFRRNGDGSLTYRASANPGWAYDAAVVGKYLFVAGSGAVTAYDVGNVATGSPTAAGSVAVTGARALDARIDAASATVFRAVVHVSQGSDNAAALQTYAYDGASFSLLTTASYAGALGTAVTVRGDYTAVSAASGTWVFPGGTYPYSPVFQAVSGPTLLQAGYLVGLGADGDPNGPSFALRSNGSIDGAIRFQACSYDAGAGGGSLAHFGGVYAASCGRNGITLFTPASAEGGRLLKSQDVLPSWSDAVAFASDGMYSWLGGPMYGTDASRLYYVNEQALADGTLYAPTWGANLQNSAFTGADPARGARAMQYQDGALFIATYGTSTATIDAYDPSGWVRLGRLTLAGSAIPTAMVTDGDYLYVARGSQIDVVDARDPTGMWTRATISAGGYTIRSLAYSRDRLYAGVDLGTEITNYSDVLVWDVSSIHAGTVIAKTKISPWEGSYVGLAVAGRLLFGALHDWNYQSPLYGLITIRLGAADRDGNGSVSLGVVPTDQPLSSPTVVGDTLYAAANLGTRTYDLTPLWQGAPGALPVEVGGANLADPFWTDTWGTPVPPLLRIEGPFGFLVGGTYRAFDLR